MTLYAPSGGLNVRFSQENLQDAIKLIDLAPSRARRATVRAINESLRWSASQLRRELAKEAGVPQKAIKGRFQQNTATYKRMTGSLWVGTYPVVAEPALIPRIVRRKKSQGLYRSKAFEATMPESGFTALFVRATPDPFTPAKNRWTEGRARTPASENLPIRRPSYDIHPSQALINRLSGQLETQFQQRAQRLLRWELEKAAQRGAR